MDAPTLTQLVVDGAPVHLLDFGGPSTADHPPLLLVHGLDGSAANWIDAGPALAINRRVLAIDLPGFGRTPLANRRLDLTSVADLVAATIMHLGQGPVEVAGNSWGGPVCLWAAARHPEVVRRAVLVAPALPRHGTRVADPAFAAAFLLPYAIPGLMRLEPARRHRQEPAARVRSLLDLCYAPGNRESAEAFDAMVEVAEQRDRRDHVTAWYRASRSLFGWMARPAVFHRVAARVTAPVHVIEGADDPIIPRTSVARALQRHPHWTHTVLDGVGHVPQLEDPTGFVAAFDGPTEEPSA